MTLKNTNFKKKSFNNSKLVAGHIDMNVIQLAVMLKVYYNIKVSVLENKGMTSAFFF